LAGFDRWFTVCRHPFGFYDLAVVRSKKLLGGVINEWHYLLSTDLPAPGPGQNKNYKKFWKTY
jgi:hypothetical protein